MKIRIIYILCFLFFACNVGTSNDKYRITFFEKEGKIEFPEGATVIRYDENMELSTYMIQVHIVESSVTDFLNKNKGFRIYEKKILGDGINFSQDDLDISDIEVYFNFEENFIPRNDNTYIYKIASTYGNKLFVFNKESGIFLGYVEK